MVKRIVIMLFVAMVLVRSHCTTYRIPGASMSNSVLSGDALICNQLVYGKRIGTFRSWGSGHVKNGDVVIFNFPEGDTVVEHVPDQSYYQLVRDHGRKNIHDPNFKIRMYTGGRIANASIGRLIINDISDRTPYIKRCVAIAGDTLEVRNGNVLVNGRPEQRPAGALSLYGLKLSEPLQLLRLQSKFGVEPEFVFQMNDTAEIPLTEKQAEDIGKMKIVLDMKKRVNLPGELEPHAKDPYFPNRPGTSWTEDSFGPVWVPREHDTLQLTMENLPIYERIIRVYENNELHVIGGRIVINGEYATSYVFQQDYYWMMGDNRHRSMDSRYWGFVPFDHIIGRADLVVYSATESQGFRSERFLKSIH